MGDRRNGKQQARGAKARVRRTVDAATSSESSAVDLMVDRMFPEAKPKSRRRKRKSGSDERTAEHPVGPTTVDATEPDAVAVDGDVATAVIDEPAIVTDAVSSQAILESVQQAATEVVDVHVDRAITSSETDERRAGADPEEPSSNADPAQSVGVAEAPAIEERVEFVAADVTAPLTDPVTPSASQADPSTSAIATSSDPIEPLATESTEHDGDLLELAASVASPPLAAAESSAASASSEPATDAAQTATGDAAIADVPSTLSSTEPSDPSASEIERDGDPSARLDKSTGSEPMATRTDSAADELAAFDALVAQPDAWAPPEVGLIDTSGVMEFALEGGPSAFESIVDDADVRGAAGDAMDALELHERSTADPVEQADATEHPQRVTSEELDELMLQSLSGQVSSAVDYMKISEEIGRLTASFESMRESALAQIRTSLAENVSVTRESELQRQVEKILLEFASVREEMTITSRATQRSLDAAESARDRVRDLHDRLSAVHSSMPRPVAHSSRSFSTSAAGDQQSDRPVLLIAAAVILLSWAVMFYVRTGDMRTAIAGLVLANLAGCGMLIHSKTGRFF